MSDSKDLYDKFVGSLGTGPLLKSDAFFFGTVTQQQPIKVILDGDDTETASVPILLARDAVVGSRVLCQLHGRQLIVVSTVVPQSRILDELGNTEHLDDLRDTHTWQQSGNADTSTSRGYPVALAGLLEVWRGYANMSYQRYTTYNGSGVYSRAYYASGGGWSPWICLATSSVWTAPTFINGWSNYANGYRVAGYRLSGENTVKLRGEIKGGTVGAGGAFTLPTNMRPTEIEQFVAASSGGVADIRIFPSGLVCVYSLFSGTNASISLAGINFEAN